MTQPVELRTGDATSLGRTPDDWLLSCQKDRFTELRDQPAGPHGTRGHLKVMSCGNLVIGKKNNRDECSRHVECKRISTRGHLRHARPSPVHPIPKNPVRRRPSNVSFKQIHFPLFSVKIFISYKTLSFQWNRNIFKTSDPEKAGTWFWELFFCFL